MARKRVKVNRKAQYECMVMQRDGWLLERTRATQKRTFTYIRHYFELAQLDDNNIAAYVYMLARGDEPQKLIMKWTRDAN